MSVLSVTLSVDRPEIIQNSILEILRDHLTSVINSSVNSIQQKISNLIPVALQSAPEYPSLISGQLRSDFGLTTPEAALSSIISNIASGFQVSVDSIKTSLSGISGGITIEILKENLVEVLPAQELGGTTIPWLQWLMTAGDAVVVANYHVVYNPPDAVVSRTQSAIMVPGGDYRLPPEFSGTVDNNWITRSLISILPEIDKIINDEIQSRI
jgi:hypothetical protein